VYNGNCIMMTCLSIITKTISFCTKITDNKDPFGTGSDSCWRGLRELKERVKSLYTYKTCTYKHTYSGSAFWTRTKPQVVHVLSERTWASETWRRQFYEQQIDLVNLSNILNWKPLSRAYSFLDAVTSFEVFPLSFC
jgi:hypothetical protein